MHEAPQGITRFTAGDVRTWHQAEGRRIFLGDVVDPGNSDTMSAGFARYAPGESNEWVVTYDEALIVTRGSFSVTSADGLKTTAAAGELIFLAKGTPVVYSAESDGADVVYVTYPHWMDAQRRSAHAGLLDSFHPADGAPATSSALALLRDIHAPFERGESTDIGPLIDAMADDVVFALPLGELHGKHEVAEYFASAAETLEFKPFERSLEYYAAGDSVVIVGHETFTVRETGATHQGEWAWVFDVRDGVITRIRAIQDLSGIADEVGRALAQARSAARA